MRNSSGGARQRAWTELLARPFSSSAELARHIGCSPDGLRPYIAALERRGYIDVIGAGEMAMIKPTGPLAPSWSGHTDEFRDWNLEPQMPASELKAAIDASGLSLKQWLATHDLHNEGGSVTRLREMANGARRVTGTIRAVVEADRKN